MNSAIGGEIEAENADKEALRGESEAQKSRLPQEKVSKSNLVDYFLTPNEDLKQHPISMKTYKELVIELFGKQFALVLAIITAKKILENYKDISLNNWANKFTEISTLNTFLVYNLISISAQLLSAWIDFMNKRLQIRQGNRINSQIVYKVLHSNLEKFTDKIPKSTLKDQMNHVWGLVMILDFSRKILNMGVYAVMLVFNINSQVGPAFLAFFGILVFHAFYGNSLKKEFTANFMVFSASPRSAKSSY